jgi:hypothetical protein
VTSLSELEVRNVENSRPTSLLTSTDDANVPFTYALISKMAMSGRLVAVDVPRLRDAYVMPTAGTTGRAVVDQIRAPVELGKIDVLNNTPLVLTLLRSYCRSSANTSLSFM